MLFLQEKKKEEEKKLYNWGVFYTDWGGFQEDVNKMSLYGS